MQPTCLAPLRPATFGLTQNSGQINLPLVRRLPQQAGLWLSTVASISLFVWAEKHIIQLESRLELFNASTPRHGEI